MRIGWASGGGHFVTIRGYLSAGQTLDIEDPWNGPSQVPYATFVNDYLGSGTWTDTYMTQ